MLVGDCDGRDVYYDEQFNPILNKDESILFSYQSYMLLYMKDAPRDYPNNLKKHWKVFEANWNYWLKSLAKGNYIWLFRRPGISQDDIPFDIYVTNLRIICISRAFPSKWIGMGGRWGHLDLYFAEKKLYEKDCARYFIFEWKEFTHLMIDDDVFRFYSIEPSGFRGNNIFSFALRRPYQVPLIQALLRLLKEKHFQFNYNTAGKVRWKELMRLFHYEDVEGLGSVYDETGQPLLEGRERLVEQRACTPIVIMRGPYRGRGLTRQPYEFIKPGPGILYQTDKRLLFIRPFTGRDWLYRPFKPEHRISFWVEWDKLRKQSHSCGVKYVLKLDKRNWLEILVPADEEKERRALNRHIRLQERRLRMWPSLIEYPPLGGFPHPDKNVKVEKPRY